MDAWSARNSTPNSRPRHDAISMASARKAIREPTYVRKFFPRELGLTETAVLFGFDDLAQLGRAP